MAHYAKLDENNAVIDTIVVADKNCIDENGVECEEIGRLFCEKITGHKKWKKTSYNTRRGVYYKPDSMEPDEDQSKMFRLNYGGFEMVYDEDLDGFIQNRELKILPRMVMNTETGIWTLPKPPIPPPEDLQLDLYPLDQYMEPWFWDEFRFQWIKLDKNIGKSYYQFTYEEMI